MNRRTNFTYDAAGNLTFDGGQNFQYDATGQQTKAYYNGYTLEQGYDGNGLRVKKSENNAVPTYYLRSSVLGGQVVAEINWFGIAWGWNRGYVYSGSGLLALQYGNAVSWVHEDPITKSKRITNSAGTVISSIELDPWGADGPGVVQQLRLPATQVHHVRSRRQRQRRSHVPPPQPLALAV